MGKSIEANDMIGSPVVPDYRRTQRSVLTCLKGPDAGTGILRLESFDLPQGFWPDSAHNNSILQERRIMQARDVMTAPVVTVRADQTIKDLASILVKNRISAAPVVNNTGKVIGMVSEGDIMRRAETGTEAKAKGWPSFLADPGQAAKNYVAAHARKVSEVMSTPVISVRPDTPLDEVATIFQERGIKRVPVIHGDDLVGIVSRANLIQALTLAKPQLEIPQSDRFIRDRLLKHLAEQPWADLSMVNVLVSNGVVTLYGVVPSLTEKKAMRVAAESLSGVTAVIDRLNIAPARFGWV
jgi:CBS domain-containing protein